MKFIKNSHFFTQNNVCAKNVAQELMKEKMFLVETKEKRDYHNKQKIW